MAGDPPDARGHRPYTLNDEEKETAGAEGRSGPGQRPEVGEEALPPTRATALPRAVRRGWRGDLEVDVHDATGERIYHETITGYRAATERTLDLSDRAGRHLFPGGAARTARAGQEARQKQ